MARKKSKKTAKKAAKKKKTPKRRAKKSAKRRRAGKLKGNYRAPTLAAARRYLKQWKKFSAEKKAKETVKIRYNEAATIVKAAARKTPGKKSKLSKRKGRGNFKLTTPAKAKAYIKRVSAQQPASKLRKHPFKPRVMECVHHLGREEVDNLIAAGQLALARAEKRKADAAAKNKIARKKRLQARAKKLLKEVEKITNGAEKVKSRYDAKYKEALAKYNKAKAKAAAARKRKRRKK